MWPSGWIEIYSQSWRKSECLAPLSWLSFKKSMTMAHSITLTSIAYSWTALIFPSLQLHLAASTPSTLLYHLVLWEETWKLPIKSSAITLVFSLVPSSENVIIRSSRWTEIGCYHYDLFILIMENQAHKLTSRAKLRPQKLTRAPLLWPHPKRITVFFWEYGMITCMAGLEPVIKVLHGWCIIDISMLHEQAPNMTKRHAEINIWLKGKQKNSWYTTKENIDAARTGVSSV